MYRKPLGVGPGQDNLAYRSGSIDPVFRSSQWLYNPCNEGDLVRVLMITILVQSDDHQMAVPGSLGVFADTYPLENSSTLLFHGGFPSAKSKEP